MSDPSFSSKLQTLFHNHVQSQMALQLHINELHAKNNENLKEAMRSLTAPMNEQIASLFTQQQEIHQLQNQLGKQVKRMKTQVNEWEKEREQIEDMMRSIGDVENWAQVIQRDMEDLIEDAGKLLRKAKISKS